MTSNLTENLVKATNVIGLKVLSKENGLQFSKVKDIIYDPQTQTVAYLVTNEGGWFSEAKVIPFSSIDIIGPDRVMVPNEFVEVKASMSGYDLNTLIQNDDIIKNLNIVTENGEKLGKVVDFYFDAQTGAVKEFEVSQGLLSNIAGGTKSLRVKAIKLVGIDAVIVEPETADKFEEQSEHQGVKGAVMGAGAVVVDTAVAAKDKVVETKDKAVEVAAQVVEDAKPRLEEMKQSAIETKDKVVEAATPYVEKAKTMASEVKDKIVESGHNTAEAAKSGMRDAKRTVDQNTPDSKEEMMDTVKQNMEKMKQNLQGGAEQAGSLAQEKFGQVQDNMEQSKIDKAIGFTLLRDVIDPKTNEIIAMKGDTIDAEIINRAKTLEILHLVTNESSYA